MLQRAAIIGGGDIGAGWAARFLLMGWDVAVCAPGAEDRVRAVIDNARRALPGLSDVAMPAEGGLTFHADMTEAVQGADWIQECLSEPLDRKRDIIQKLQAGSSPDNIMVASSSDGGISALQDGAARPGQILVARAVEPVYLLPLVELGSSAANPPAVVARAAAILTSLGMRPLPIGAKLDGPVTDLLLYAILREARRIVDDGQATATQVNDTIRYGFGLNFAQSGLLKTDKDVDHSANDAGFSTQFEHFADHSGASDHPDRDATDRSRDDTLVTLLRGLKARDAGAGRLLNAHDKRMDRLPLTLDDVADLSQPVTTLHRAVPLDWTDYNGHMTEARYLHAFGEATDRLMALVGCDMDYVASGVSFFTAETHIRHVDEVHAGARIHVVTQVLLGQGKKMHLFHRMYDVDRLLATGEHMLIHVSLTTRKACIPDDRIAVPLGRLAQAHADLPWPEGAGRAVGRK